MKVRMQKDSLEGILQDHILDMPEPEMAEEIIMALEHTKKVKAVKELERMLENDLKEFDWQKWFENNSWILGSDFVRVLDERRVDAQNISDFLIEAFDGFLDIIEIKKPDRKLSFWRKNRDHKNYIPSLELIKAITQATKYIYEVEREANSIKFLERVGNVKTIKPRCILIFGRSHTWNQEQAEAFRILNSNYHNLTILTYDQVLNRAKRIIGIRITDSDIL